MNLLRVLSLSLSLCLFWNEFLCNFFIISHPVHQFAGLKQKYTVWKLSCLQGIVHNRDLSGYCKMQNIAFDLMWRNFHSLLFIIDSCSLQIKINLPRSSVSWLQIGASYSVSLVTSILIKVDDICLQNMKFLELFPLNCDCVTKLCFATVNEQFEADKSLVIREIATLDLNETPSTYGDDDDGETSPS